MTQQFCGGFSSLKWVKTESMVHICRLEDDSEISWRLQQIYRGCKNKFRAK